MVILSDMDGTLLDTEKVTFRHYTIECRKKGRTIEPSFYLGLLGCNMRKIHAELEAYFPDLDVDELIQSVHRGMREEFRTKGVPLKRGAMELVRYCRENAIKFGVATSSSRTRVDELLTWAGLMPYVDGCVCGDEISCGKPNPEIFLKLCAKLGAKESDCLVLEDAETGMEAAHACGMRAICIPDLKEPRKECLHGAPSVRSLEEVLKRIKEGNI
ncbi:MAG: HAD family phosphatase [Clostridia bacterium]|nr:HAD family phosphatase [Clostridia bacterium]